MMAIAVRRYHRTTTAAAADEPEAAPVLDPEERVVWERSAEAAGVRKLELEAERLVSVHLDLSGPKEPGASWRPFRLILEIEPGWHIQANPASEAYLVPTAVAAEGAALREVRYPEGDELKPDFAQAPLAVYEGRVEIRGEIGEMGPEACLRITYQLCDDTHCLPEATREVSVS
jgi:hypothetical protein